MKRVWMLIALLLVLLITGCSVETSKAARPTDAEGLYEMSCLNCHGADFKGAAGPPVVNMSSKYNEEELLKLINEGKGMMPGKLLTEEEARIVTKWLLEK